MGFLRRTVLSAAAFALAAAASAALPTGTTGVSSVAVEKKKVLVFSRIEGFNHKASVAACKEMMAAEAEKGAFAVDFSDDYAALEISNLVKYAALVLNNTTHLKTKDHPSVAPSICSYVRWGGGLCVIRRVRLRPPRGRSLRRPPVGGGRNVGVQGGGPRQPDHRAVQGLRRR